MPKNITILESEENKPFKIKGIAMIKNSLSKNGRFYSDKLVESIVEKMSSIIESNGSYPLSMMADHPGVTTNKTLSVVGRITNMYLDGDNAIIEAEIANTTVGKDIQELVRGKFVEGLSIRASKAIMKKKYIGSKVVNDVMEMELKGVDLVVNPGVDGAKVLDIIESDETNSGFNISIEEEEIVKEELELDYSKITLEEFKSKRPDLFESIKQELKPVFEGEFNLNDLQESVENLTTDKAELEGKLQESEKTVNDLKESESSLKTKLEEAEGQLNTINEEKAAAEKAAKIAELMSGSTFAESVKEKIKGKLEEQATIEDIEKVYESETEYLNMVIKESTGVDVKHKGQPGDNGANQNINEDEDFIKLVEGL